MKEKLIKMLEAKRAQRDALNKSMIDTDGKEERAAIGETLSELGKEIRELEDMLAEADKPADEGAQEGARSASVVATVETRKAEPTKAETIEARADSFAKSERMSIDAAETRSVLISTGAIAKPDGVGGINDPFNIVSSIVDLVKVEDMTGMGGHKEAYITAWQSAAALTDGSAPSGSDPTFKTVAINPFLLGVVTYVSRELRKQSPLNYAQKVQEGALIALKKKLGNWLVAGGGSNEIFGIVNAVNTDNSPATMVEELDMSAAIGADTLRKIVFQYGGSENLGGAAALLLNKLDLIAFGDVRGTNDKKAVYEIIPDGENPNKGVIKDGGLAVPYIISSDVTAYSTAVGTPTGVKTMIYGDPKNYKLGLFGNYEVNVSDDYKFGEGLLTVRGEVMVGGNVIVDKGFVVLTKKDA